MHCRSSCFSCIDCGQDFYGSSYNTHVKCISEAQKYESKGFVEKANKGEAKQNAWFEVKLRFILLVRFLCSERVDVLFFQKVLNAINNSNPSPKARQLLQRVQDYPNVPRKKAKFIVKKKENAFFVLI